MILAIRHWLRTDFVAALRLFAWACAVTAGFWVGWFVRRYYDEVEFIQKADRFYAEARAAHADINRAYEEQRTRWYDFLETGCGGR